MRFPRPFAVYISGAFAFTVHAYSITLAREIVAARLADMIGVRIVAGSLR
jgi:hypothetical protein